MLDDVSRLVGIEGLVVLGVREVGEQARASRSSWLARAGCCRWCGRRVGGGQGPAGRAGARSADRGPRDGAALAQAPLSLRGVRADVHRDAPAVAGAPARDRALSRAAVRALPRRRRACRGRARGAHHALSGRARVRGRRRRAARRARARARRGGSRSMRRLIAAATSWPPSSPIWTAGASSRSSTAAADASSSAGCGALPESERARDRGRLDRPLRRLPASDPRRAAAGADRRRPLPPRPRRQHRAGQRAPRAPAPGTRRRPKGARRRAGKAGWRPELYHARHRLLKARERLTARQRRQLCELFAPSH